MENIGGIGSFSAAGSIPEQKLKLSANLSGLTLNRAVEVLSKGKFEFDDQIAWMEDQEICVQSKADYNFLKDNVLRISINEESLIESAREGKQQLTELKSEFTIILLAHYTFQVIVKTDPMYTEN
ncbi:MAG: hypothetical protein Q8K75_11965 [Chlamydiales bacterium]|nr:hypothetical protein [Chlamydiales bacterium]